MAEKKNPAALAAREIMVYLEVYYNSDWKAIHKHITEKKYIPDPETVREFLEARGIKVENFSTILDDDYPAILLHLPFPPHAIHKQNIHYMRYKVISDMFKVKRPDKSDKPEEHHEEEESGDGTSDIANHESKA